MTGAQRGFSNSVPLAVVVPVVMAILLGAIQAAVWYTGRCAVQQIALATAEQVAYLGETSGPQTIALETAAAHGLTGTVVQVDVSPTEVHVRVQAGVPTLLPQVSTIASQAVRPREPGS